MDESKLQNVKNRIKCVMKEVSGSNEVWKRRAKNKFTCYILGK